MCKLFNKSIIFIMIVITFCICFKIVNATNDDISNFTQEFNNEIGEVNTKNMFEDLQKEVKNLTNATTSEIKNTIKNISEKYGLILNEEQLNTLTNYFENMIKNDDRGIFNTIKNLFNKFINWLKNLGNDSKITIEPKDEEENSNLIESKDDTVTINIPTVNDFDNIINKIIDKVKYIFIQKEDA